MQLYTFCLLDTDFDKQVKVYAARMWKSYEEAEKVAKTVSTMMGGIDYQIEPHNIGEL